MPPFLEKHRPVVLVVCALVLTATIAASWGATTADIRLRATLFGLLALILAGGRVQRPTNHPIR